MLGFLITREIYARYPELSEGELSRLRAATVSARALAGVAREIGLGEHLLLGAGERSSGGRDKTSILADACEAVLGAAYLAVGLDQVAVLVLRLFGPLLDAAVQAGDVDAKTTLQERAAVMGVAQPDYRVTRTGPDEAPLFAAEVWLAGSCAGRGEGTTKKAAEQAAAREAMAGLPGPGSPAGDA